MKKALFSLFAAAIAAAVPSYAAITGSGTEAKPYLIASDADWAAFADTNNAAVYWAGGVHARLEADVNATVRLGNEFGYSGVFDGGGHTVTAHGTAPFSLKGATVRNVKVAGTVSGGNHTAGFTGGFKPGGSNLIENCVVLADITGAQYAGGFVGHGSGESATDGIAVTLRGCVFAGTIATPTSPRRVGTFWGWSGNNSSVTLEDCFDASDLTDPIGLGWGTVAVTNVYYAKAGKTAGGGREWPEAKRGTFVRAVSFGEGVLPAGAARECGGSGLAFYGDLLRYEGLHWCEAGKTFEVGFLGGDGYLNTIKVEDAAGNDITATALSGTTVAMPDADVTITRTAVPNPAHFAQDGDVCTILSSAGWEVFCDLVNSGAESFAGKTVRLGADISVSRMAGTGDRPFRGTFDGQGHTMDLDVLDTENQGAAPFHYVAGATIRYVRTTGRVEGTLHCAGLVGFAKGATNLVHNCDVLATIACTGGAHSHCGGVLGHGSDSATTLRDCRFAGTIAGAATAAGVLYGWGDWPGPHAIENCLDAGTCTSCNGVDLLRKDGGAQSVENCWKFENHGSLGTRTDARGETLRALLGDNWKVDGNGDVVPILDVRDLPRTVRFDANGGTGSMADQTFFVDVAQNLSSNAFVRADHLFLRWTEAADGSGESWADGQSFTVTGAVFSTTLYAQWTPAVLALAPQTGDTILVDGQTLTGTGGEDTHVVIAPGATVTLSNAVITAALGPWSGITCLGDATIVLVGTNVVATGDGNYPGVQAGPPGTTLAIRGDGRLDATSSCDGDWGYAAGIGSEIDGSCGDIAIEGGVVNADGSYLGYGIGCGGSGACGDISISGGVVTATGAGGIGGDAGDVTISGGTVTAYGYMYKAVGVGSGHSIAIAEGLKVEVDGAAAPAAFAERAATCATNEATVLVGPCGHGGDVFSDAGGRPRCAWCGAEVATADGGTGAADDPWIIRTTRAWNWLSDAVAGGLDTAGAFVRLAADVSVTNAVGAEGHPFCGTFDGGAFTLTVALQGTGYYVAPFSAISNATIANLSVAGTVAGNMHCSGLVGLADGANLVSNCLVSAAVSSTGSHFGGVLGHGHNSTTQLRGCTFAGSLSGPSGANAGTLWAWSDAARITLADCLDLSDCSHPVGRGGGTPRTVSNVYYTHSKTTSGALPWYSGAGKRARSVTSAADVEIGFGEPRAVYGVAGFEAFQPGFRRGGAFYAGEGDSVPLSLAEIGAEPGAEPLFVAGAGTLSVAGAGWTLGMPNEDVTVSVLYPIADGAVLTGERAVRIVLEAGATVTISNLSVNASGALVNGPGITCLGDATIVLKGENVVNGYGNGSAGIQAGPAGTRLVVRGEGSLSAEGAYSAAGIGCGKDDDCGDIAIEGGTVEAYGGSGGAGIGAAESRSCGDITILGDEIDALGGDEAPGIGAVYGSCGRIVVKGGFVRAEGDYGAAGIGGGVEGRCAGVSLLGGTVAATGGYYAAGVGSGWCGTCGPVVVSRGVFRVEAEAGQDAPFSVGKGADYVDPNYPDDAYLAECAGVTAGGVATNGIAESPWTYVGMNGAAPGRVVDLAALDADFTAQDGDTLFGALAGPYQVFVDRGATILLRDAAITNDVGAGMMSGEGIRCYGDATILLAGENVLRAFYDDCAGIEARNGTLEIDGAGSLAPSGRAGGAGIRAGALSIGPGIVRVSATKGESAAACIDAASVAVADVLFDETAGDTRTFFRVTDLSSCTGLYMAQDGEILTGTPPAGCAVAVAAGATVTLRNLVLPADQDFKWLAPLYTLGDATIRLEGSNAVSACANYQSAVVVAPDSTLVLDGPGSLDARATGEGGVGIGSSNDQPGGNLVVRGGVVRATGGRYAPGIGASPEYGFGDITIEGGTVTAAGGDYAAGIGSGDDGECGDISISGGTVTATGGYEGAGIGAGNDGGCGDVSVSGGIVLAAGGYYAAGIGSGEYGTCGAVSIGAGVTRVVADAGRNASHSVGAGNDGTCGALTVGGAASEPIEDERFIYPAPGGGTVSGTVDLATVFWDIVVLDGAVLTGEPLLPFKIEIDAGASVTASNVTVLGKNDDSYAWAGITCLGDATVALEGTNVLRGFHEDYPGLQAGPGGTTLRILGPGALVADSNGYAPGIGDHYNGGCGNISIEGGTVTATGGDYAAGIGSSEEGRCGDISISGGTVTATGGKYAAGIGAGDCGTCGDIVFSGGVSTATGGRSAPAVGCGSDGVCGDVTLANTVTRVTAVAGSALSPCCIGTGWDGSCGAVTVGGTSTGDIVPSPYVYEPSDSVFLVSFDGNGGEGRMADLFFLPGIPQNLPPNDFRLDGKVFLGWSDAADGSGAFYRDEQSFVATADTTLYAQWNDFDATLTENTGWMRLVDGQSLAGTAGTNAHVIVAAGATVTLRGVTILGVNDPDRPWAAVTCEGNATIVLEGTNVLRGFYEDYPGLRAGPAGTTLRILGPGSLAADSNGYGTGVGGGYYTDCGDISVEGGTIVAVGGWGEPGIGGGENASCGTVSVSGGDVSAWSVDEAPGIGGGMDGSCGGVAISGGVVAARGGREAPGIGPGYDGDCGEVSVSGASAVVLAVCGFQATDAIASSDAVTVDGGLADSEDRGIRAIRPPELVSGENRLTLDGDGEDVRVFTPAADGWYRFRIPGEAGWLLPTDIDIQLTMEDPDGSTAIQTFGARTWDLDLDAFAELQGGMTYKLAFASSGIRGPDILPLFVDAEPVHGIALDAGTANGTIRLVDTGLPPVEGSFVALEAEPADGFALAAWTVTDATGGVVRVRTEFDGTPGFPMPDSDVFVSASFAQPHAIDLGEEPRGVSVQSVAANGILGDEAAPGALVEIEAMLHVAPELTLAASGVSTASGVPVACSVRRSGLVVAILSFTMPDEPVVVEPVLERAPPAASIGEELGNVVPAAPDAACRSFVPAFTGEYAFRGEHGGVFQPEIYAVDGLWVQTSYDQAGPDGNDVAVSTATATLLAGREYFICWQSTCCDLLTVVNTGATYDEDLLPAVVTEAGAGGTLEVSATRAVEGHPISIHATPAPGFRVANLVAVDASGSSVRIFEPYDGIETAPYFTMPSRSVTVRATFALDGLPAYLADADDFVKANYLAWALRYGKADPDGTHEEAFLLDIDPDTPLDGKTLLEISDFAVTPTNLLFEIASDATALVAKSGPDDGYVNNGVLVIQASTEPDPRSFSWGSPWPVSGKNGRILVEMQFPTGNIPDASFFRAKLYVPHEMLHAP